MKRLLIFLILIYSYSSAQINEITKFNALPHPVKTTATSIVQSGNGDLLLFWADSTKLFYSRSKDYGLSWLPITLLSEDSVATHIVSDINLLTMNNGRILLTYKTTKHFLLYSDDNGISWSEPNVLPTINSIIRKRYMDNSSITQISDTLVSFIYSSNHSSNSNFIFQIKSNDGINWSDQVDTLLNENQVLKYGTLVALNEQNLILFYVNEKNINTDDYTKTIYMRNSLDGGKTWDEPVELIIQAEDISRPKVIRDNSGTIWLVYQEEVITSFEDITQSDIQFIKSNDNGITWSNPQVFTTYKGFDNWHNVNLINDKPLISFSSTRDTKLLADEDAYNIFFGIPEESDDLFTPPVIYKKEFVYINNYPKINMKIKAYVNDDDVIKSVFFKYQIADTDLTQLELYDDGAHNDEQSNDGIYGNIINGLSYNYSLKYFFELIDNSSKTAISIQSNVSSPFNNSSTMYAMDVNNLWLPLNNKGVLADAVVPDSTGTKKSQGRFEESNFIFSGGFSLSGYNNGKLWANGQMSASRIQDYYPGKVNSDPSNSQNRVYFLKSNFPAFSETWQMWKDAVKLGAKFYDGDGNGIYEPVDKNGNGQWDPNEDRPDLIGDQTAWCVFNDAVSAQDRNFSNVTPQGIEVKQTAFAYSPQTHPQLANVIFIRYNIENAGTVADKFDSVYFGAWSDPDLGDYIDDLIGCDTLLNSSICYNKGQDDEYGDNPPAFLITLLQGPVSFIPNETFIDNDGNNIYDEGIDVPLDTAKIFSGILLSKEYIEGAKNQDITSSIHYMSAHPTQGDPDDEYQFRCYMEGRNQACGTINPCNWEFGQVLNIDCDDVNPKFMYSGDPVIQFGWLNTNPMDQRLMVNTGPFTLEKDKPIEIIIAYVVGRGSDALNSITTAKDITRDVIGFYNTNFSYIPVGIKETKTETIPTKFVLEQNYPNPFNPTTTIKYSIPTNIKLPPLAKGRAGVGSQVTLKVYDILGREVAVLVNERQEPGNYKTVFHASNLSSGIYYYSLNINGNVLSKKMILLK